MRLLNLHLITVSTLATLAVADFHVFDSLMRDSNSAFYTKSFAVASNQYGCDSNNLHEIGVSGGIVQADSWSLQGLCGQDQINASKDQSTGGFNLSGGDGSSLGFCNLMQPQNQIVQVSSCTQPDGAIYYDRLVCYSPVCN